MFEGTTDNFLTYQSLIVRVAKSCCRRYQLYGRFVRSYGKYLLHGSDGLFNVWCRLTLELSSSELHQHLYKLFCCGSNSFSAIYSDCAHFVRWKQQFTVFLHCYCISFCFYIRYWWIISDGVTSLMQLMNMLSFIKFKLTMIFSPVLF